MEDRLPLAPTTVQWFQCPGQSRPIDRAIHLSRLAAFDPACLTCPVRHDVEGLSSLAIAARAEVERRAAPGWQWTADGLVTSERGQLDEELPRQFAFAMADVLWSTGRDRPSVHVGASGTHRANELMAAICRDLELAGCDACEVGSVTAPCLATGIAQSGADGGIWIGNSSGREHELTMLPLGHQGIPWSLPERLADIRARIASGVARPRRSGGKLRRFDAARRYLPAFRAAFHGLRALEFVLQTVNDPLVEYVKSLSRETALRVRRLDLARPRATDDGSIAPIAAELTAVSHEVILNGAHFGLWADGAGQRCELVDERGQIIAHKRLEQLLRRATTAVPGEPAARPEAPLDVTREQPGSRMASESVVGLVADGGGGYCFGGQAAPDALAVLCALLVLLSRSDRPLSQVLDAAAPAL